MKTVLLFPIPMSPRSITSALLLALLLTAAGPALAQAEPTAQPPQVARNTEAAPGTSQTEPAVLEERMRGMRIEYQSGFELMQSEHRAIMAKIETEHRAMRAEHEAILARMDAEHEAILARMDASDASLRTEIAQLENRLILWLVGWTTGLMALLPLYLALLRRYLPKLLTA